jgi:hypothetical protein
MGSNTMYLNVVTARTALAVLLLLLSGPALRPAYAQFELVGSWDATGNEDLAGDGLPVDYTGYPLTEEARLRGLSYSQSQLAMIERQCQGWPVFYFAQGPFGLRIWSDTEKANGTPISYTIGAWENRAPFVIWMDGRPHPSPSAAHTRAGFTTGHWEGNTLVTYTTHMQVGFLRKTGVPSSDQAKLTTRFFRHGDLLTVLAIIDDPIHLAEPQMLTKNFRLSTAAISPVGPACIAVFEGTELGESVAHYAPEKNPFIDEMTKKFGVPRDAALGIPETLYPEYRKKMKASAARPTP